MVRVDHFFLELFELSCVYCSWCRGFVFIRFSLWFLRLLFFLFLEIVSCLWKAYITFSLHSERMYFRGFWILFCFLKLLSRCSTISQILHLYQEFSEIWVTKFSLALPIPQMISLQQISRSFQKMHQKMLIDTRSVVQVQAFEEFITFRSQNRKEYVFFPGSRWKNITSANGVYFD